VPSAATSTREVTEPFFFESQGGARLFGVWRAPSQEIRSVWVICPPFAEEEKSAHRTLVELCETMRARGDASLFFGYRGTADSSGDFAQVTLALWCDDIRAACREAQRRAPGIPLGFIGLRLGASLAATLADEAGASRLVLIEPVLNGRSYVGAMSQRKKLRAMMTQNDLAQNAGSHYAGSQNAAADVVPGVNGSAASTQRVLVTGAEADIDDLDGWPLSATLRNELQALDLMSQAAPLGARTLVVQVGPREQIAPPLQRFAHNCGATAQAVVMKPFWNMVDYTRADALFEAVLKFEF
jgi:alpha/beta superfamily hydrolase